MNSPFKTLGSDALAISLSKGWYTPTTFDEVDSIGTKLCLIHTEVSEAMEAVRDADFENFSEELADVIIRVVQLSAGLGVDLDTAIEKKMKRNRHRAHQHGGRRA